MDMIITTRKHSYMVNKIDETIEVGSVVFIPEEKTWHMITAPGVMTAIDEEQVDTAVKVSTVEELTNIMSAISGDVNVALAEDMALTTYVPIAGEGNLQMNLNNHNIIREDGTALYINGENVIVDIKGEGEVAGHQAVFCGAGTVNIHSGTFKSNHPNGSDCIYALDTGKINIYGGEFFAELNEEDFAEPTYSCLNIKDGSRITASINVYGGTFHNFNPADNVAEGPGTSFVAPGYKAVEESEGVFVVVAE